MGAGKLAHRPGRIELEAELRDDLPGAFAHRRAIENAAARDLAAEEQILLDREVRDQRELLEDRADAHQPGLVRGQATDLAAGIVEAAGIRREGAGDDVDQGRLAGAVLAE